MGFVDDPAYHTYTLFEGRASVVMPLDHPLATRESLGFEDLRDVKMVAVNMQNSKPAIQHLESVTAQYGFSPRIVQWGSDIETVLMLVESGAGVAVLSHHMVDLYGNSRVKCIDLAGEEGVVRDIVVWKKATDNPLVHRFLASLGIPLL